ncbi:MAG: carbohydrate ABC transporter permease [Gaiellaceae bacterium]
MSAQAPPLQVPQPKRRFGRSREGTLRERMQGVLFALPALIVLALFVLYPAYYTVRLAFYKSDFLFSFTDYVGLQNFRDLFEDKNFWDTSHFPPEGAFFNNIKWIVLYISLCLILGLALAVLTIRVRYESAVKSIIFVPMAISATAVAVIWLLVYSPNPDIGTVNAVINAFGGNPISWLGKPSTVNYAIIIAYVWASTGFAMVVLSAALKGIPTEIIEAARVDGAGEWNIFRRIMLPLLSLPISIVTVWLFINVIKVFDIIYVMTSGGPGTSSRVIAYTMFTETFGGNPGKGAAVAVIMLLLMIPVMILNVKRFRSERVMT